MLDARFLDADLLQCALARHYEPRFGHGKVSIGNFGAYDIEFDKCTVEVKCDEMAATTGNACIEYWNSGTNKPTGILETQARLWVHCVPSGSKLMCYEMGVKTLTRLCIEIGRVKAVGIGGMSLCKLLPMDKIKQISSQVFELDYDIYGRRDSAA